MERVRYRTSRAVDTLPFCCTRSAISQVWDVVDRGLAREGVGRVPEDGNLEDAVAGLPQDKNTGTTTLSYANVTIGKDADGARLAACYRHDKPINRVVTPLARHHRVFLFCCWDGDGNGSLSPSVRTRVSSDICFGFLFVLRRQSHDGRDFCTRDFC